MLSAHRHYDAKVSRLRRGDGSYRHSPNLGAIMEVHEIRYFLALAETLNFTRAADRCNVSQPALTRAIQHLEDKLGGPLVHRERGNTHLTELGRIMHPHFQEVAQQMEEARK